MVFKEVMIDHLEIESSTVLAESMDGKEQIAKYGIPVPEDGKFVLEIVLNIYINLYLENEEDKNVRLALLAESKRDNGGEIQVSVKNNTNQFSFIERANQSRVEDFDETESQTDPPPM